MEFLFCDDVVCILILSIFDCCRRVCFGTGAPARQWFGQRRSFQKGTTNLRLGVSLTRFGGQVRAGLPFRAGFLLSQNQPSPTMHTRAMIVKMIIMLLSILPRFGDPLLSAAVGSLTVEFPLMKRYSSWCPLLDAVGLSGPIPLSPLAFPTN